MIPVGLGINGHWRIAEMYVDSGAFYTLLHASFAVDFGLDFKRGPRVNAQVGDGSLIPVYLHRLPMQIGATRLNAAVGFSEKLGVRFLFLVQGVDLGLKGGISPAPDGVDELHWIGGSERDRL